MTISSTRMAVPVIDFTQYSLDLDSSTVETSELKQLSDEIVEAFESKGCLYLKNFGISPSEVG